MSTEGQKAIQIGSIEIKHPYIKARILLSGLGLIGAWYWVGGLVFLIPAWFFVSEYGTLAGSLLTVLFLTAIISYLAYRAYKEALENYLQEAEQVTRDRYPDLSDILDFIDSESKDREMEPPKLYIDPSQPISNACAVGRRQNGHIIIFEGMLAEIEDKDELRAIIAHEIAHIDNRHTTLSTLIEGVAALITKFWAVVGFTVRHMMYERRGIKLTTQEQKALWHKMDRRAEYFNLFWDPFRKSISRHREYIADIEAAASTNPEHMKNALESLEEANYQPEDPSISQSLCIFGSSSGWLSGLRSTHPSKEKRIQRIDKRFTQE